MIRLKIDFLTGQMDETDVKKQETGQVQQKMDQTFVDLYKYWGRERPDGCSGWLHCYVQRVPASVSSCRTRPGVLVIPGGGYSHVSQREAEPVALRFLCGGYCAFVLDYSVAPARFPVQLQEAAMAMGYIRRNADQLGVDPHGGGDWFFRRRPSLRYAGHTL